MSHFNNSPQHDALLALIRMGVGQTGLALPQQVDWVELQVLARQQGVANIVLDGIENLPNAQKPPKISILTWIGETLQDESIYAQQQKTAIKLAQLFHDNNIRTYVLKGTVVAECYPKPSCRLSADFDCFLLPEVGDDDVWELGNQLVERRGFEVKRNFYKNSTLCLPELTVENHRYLVPFRGNKTLRRLQQYLQNELRSYKPLPSDFFHQTSLCRPPVMVSALFLIEHAYSHFLHEGLNWRHVLDWVMFSKKHQEEIDWAKFESRVDEYEFRKFYDSYCQLGEYLLGRIEEDDLSVTDKKMLADIWATLDLHDTVLGVKGKLNLASNTLRARWKYRYFSELSMLHALWIQVKGYLFIKQPTLD